jgi:acyl carrier protein
MSHTQGQVLDKLQTVFDEIFIEPPTLTSELTAQDVPEWDSLLHISLVLAVEKAFAVRFRVGEVESARNVGEFAGLIARRMTES